MILALLGLLIGAGWVLACSGILAASLWIERRLDDLSSPEAAPQVVERATRQRDRADLAA